MKNYSSSKTDFIKNTFEGFLNGKIIDLGCNEGIVAEEIKLNKIKYLGVDIDDSALKKVKDKGFSTRKIDLSKDSLPFRNSEFDSFLCLDILEHLQDPKKIIREINRIVKSKGRGIVALPNDLNLTNILKILFTGRSLVTRDTLWSPFGHLHFASIKESVNLIKNQFKVLKIYFVPSNYTVPILPVNVKFLLAKSFPRFFCQSIVFRVENKK